MAASESDPYLVMRPNPSVGAAPKKVRPYLETVHRVSEWMALGFPISIDQFGFPRPGHAKKYRFVSVDPSDPEIAEAIGTGKKATRDALRVAEYVMAGCALDEFIALPEDVRCFSQGRLFAAQERHDEALSLLARAVQLRPQYHKYREALYSLRVSLSDLAAIDEEFEFFWSDIDCLLHAGRVDEWLKALIGAREFSRARTTLEKVDTALMEMEKGSLKPQFYAEQAQEWYAFKHRQFAMMAEKYRARISRLEAPET
jgi:tetratricopeptide (TPR) repeat protein